MSEMELGGKVSLTVPQLRTYLSCLDRVAGKSNLKAEGVEYAREQLLKCLNLPPDWTRLMDEKEYCEVKRRFER